MIKVKEIKLERAEGPNYLINPDTNGFKEFSFSTFKEVAEHINLFGPTYPKQGADKHDFTVTWEDGYQYNGRVELQHPQNERYSTIENSIGLHIRAFVEHLAKEVTPDYISDAKGKAEAREFLEKYALTDNPDNSGGGENVVVAPEVKPEPEKDIFRLTAKGFLRLRELQVRKAQREYRQRVKGIQHIVNNSYRLYDRQGSC